MRCLISRFLVLSISLTLIPTATVSAEPEVAVRAEGYLGYADLDLFLELDAFQGGGAGSVSAVFDQFYIQADVFGDVTDFDSDTGADFEAKTVGPGLHLGWRDADRGSLGAVGTYTNLDLGAGDFDIFRVGGEGEIYLNQLTLGLIGGYTDLDGGDFGYLEGAVTYYPTERARLSYRLGGLGIESSNPGVSMGLSGEFLVNDVLAPFVRWEALLPDDFGDVAQYGIVGGLRVYWGAETPTLQGYDRGYFKSNCQGIWLVGRLC